ncbi:MAG: hypothetical protein WCQ65_10960 [Fermentimonas sp.]
MSKPTELIKEYESLESEIFAMQDEIEDLHEMRESGETRIKELIEIHQAAMDSGIELTFTKGQIYNLDKKILDNIIKIDDMAEDLKGKRVSLGIIEAKIRKEGWKVEYTLIGQKLGWEEI